MASRATADLTFRFREKFALFCMFLTEAGVPFVIAQTLRSIEESQANMDKGTSWVSTAVASKHVDAYFRGWDTHGSDAADIVPYDVYMLHGPDKLQWNAADPIWLKVRDAAVRAGLRWGVVNSKGIQVDPGHVAWDGAIYGPRGPRTPGAGSSTLSV